MILEGQAGVPKMTHGPLIRRSTRLAVGRKEKGTSLKERKVAESHPKVAAVRVLGAAAGKSLITTKTRSIGQILTLTPVAVANRVGGTPIRVGIAAGPGMALETRAGAPSVASPKVMGTKVPRARDQPSRRATITSPLGVAKDGIKAGIGAAAKAKETNTRARGPIRRKERVG